MGSITDPQKGSNYDEIFMQHSLQFAESLKDLKVLKKQLYSAAEYFESSYDKDDHQILVMDSSKDYLAKALVNTVDHLGSVADKLNKFLDEKADEFNSTNARFSCIEQKLGMFKGFVDSRGVSQHSLIIEAPKHNKQYILPDTVSFPIRKSELIYRNCIMLPHYDMNITKRDNPFSKAFQAGVAAGVKPQLPLSRKGVAKNESSSDFSFVRVMSKKETGKPPVSPIGVGFPLNLKRSGSVANRSVSPTFSYHERNPTEPRRAMSVQMRNREGQIVESSYARRSKHLFRPLLKSHRSTKHNY